MNTTEFQGRVNISLSNIVNSFMNENEIPATMMERALEKALLQIKDQVLLETLMNMNQQKPEEETTEKEEEKEE